jgi:prophage antirepressor-like protein
MEELKIITIGRKKYISEKDLIFLILRARDTTVEKFQNWMIECILTNHEKTSEEFDEKNFYLYLDRV